jgi:hypothetical protein
MKSLLPCLGIVALLALAPLLAAQNVTDESPLPRRVVTPAYDLSKEVQIQGAIQDVVGKPTVGLMLGAHLMVVTPQGTVDVQIGRSLLRGPNAVSFTAGEQIRAVGMQSTFQGHAVFLARLVQTPGGTIEVRDEHGVEISPAARKVLARQGLNPGGAQ